MRPPRRMRRPPPAAGRTDPGAAQPTGPGAGARAAADVGGQGQVPGLAGWGDPGQGRASIQASAPIADAGELDWTAGVGPGPPPDPAVGVPVAGDAAEPPTRGTGHHRPSRRRRGPTRTANGARRAGPAGAGQRRPGRRTCSGGAEPAAHSARGCRAAGCGWPAGRRGGSRDPLPFGCWGEAFVLDAPQHLGRDIQVTGAQAGGREPPGAGQLVGLPPGDSQPLGGLGQGIRIRGSPSNTDPDPGTVGEGWGMVMRGAPPGEGRRPARG